MSIEFKDKVAIVTGGTRGIGFGLAEALLVEGAKVFVCGRQETSLKAALQALKSHAHERVDGIRADVSCYQDCYTLVKKAVERFGRLDILVNNAGIGHIYQPLDQITPEVWEATINTNLSGMFYCCHQAVPFMRSAGAGYIFNISSVAAVVRLAGGSAYNASKTGLVG